MDQRKVYEYVKSFKRGGNGVVSRARSERPSSVPSFEYKE